MYRIYSWHFKKSLLYTTTQFLPFAVNTSENPKINVPWFYHYSRSLQWLLH